MGLTEVGWWCLEPKSLKENYLLSSKAAWGSVPAAELLLGAPILSHFSLQDQKTGCQ